MNELLEFISQHPILSIIVFYIFGKTICSIFRILLNRENYQSITVNKKYVNCDDDDWDNDCSCNNIVVVNGKRYCCKSKE